MESEHTIQLAADYALGLLSAEECRRVESHARGCAACRLALHRERQVGALLRDAVQAVQPAPGRLAALRPSLPAPRPRSAPLAYRLAPLTLVAVLLALGLLWASGRAPFAPGFFPPASPTMTATHTQTPTATTEMTNYERRLLSSDEMTNEEGAARCTPSPDRETACGVAAAPLAVPPAAPPPAATPIILAAIR